MAVSYFGWVVGGKIMQLLGAYKRGERSREQTVALLDPWFKGHSAAEWAEHFNGREETREYAAMLTELFSERKVEP